MSRVIILISLCFYIISLFTWIDSIEASEFPLKKKIIKRKFDSIRTEALAPQRVPGQDVNDSFLNPPRIKSENNIRTNEATSNTMHNFHSYPKLQTSTSTHSSSLTASLSIKIEDDLNPDIKDFDSFKFNSGIGIIDISIEELSNMNKSELIKEESDQISKHSSEPFRADYNGKTVIVIPSGLHEEKYIKAACISYKHFQEHLLLLSSCNLSFETLGRYNEKHLLLDCEMGVINIDPEFTESKTSQEQNHGNIPPLHPLYSLAREALIADVFQGKTSFIKDAISAGINMNFSILVEPIQCRMNFLQFLLKYGSNRSQKLIDMLVNKAKIDLKYYDSDGLSLIHNLAISDDVEALISIERARAGKIDLNCYTNRSNFAAAIHLAAKFKSYRFLKYFLNLPGVNINAPDSFQNHVIFYAINLDSFSFFSDLLKHPKIVLKYEIVRKSFILIRNVISIQDSMQFYVALAEHLVTRHRAHVSHLHFTIYCLLLSENIAALEAFKFNGFDFSFIHKGQRNFNDSTPLLVAISHDRVNSFKFLQQALPRQLISQLVSWAVFCNSCKILQFLLETDQVPEISFESLLNSLLQSDNAEMFQVVMGKLGQEKVWTLIDKEQIYLSTCPNIVVYLSTL